MRGSRQRIVHGMLVAAAVCAAGATAGQQQDSAGPAFKVVGKWGGVGTTPGKFGGASLGLAVDKAGTVYVADSNANRFQSFSSKGAFRKVYAVPTDGTTPDVAVDADGNVWGTTQVNAQVLRYPKTGGAPEAFATPKTADGIAVDADGNVYVSTSGDAIHEVVRFDKTPTGWEPAKTWARGLQAPGDIEVSADGSVYVADTRGSPPTVKRYDTSGKLLKVIRTLLPATAGAGAQYGIGVDPDCNLWMTDPGQRRVEKFSPSGKLLGTATSGDMLATDIAIGPSGDLYVFDVYGPSSVVRFALDSSKPATAPVPAKIVVSKGKATVKYAATGIACPAEIDATASLTGKGISGKAAVKVSAGKTTAIVIPMAKAASGPATFKIVLKTNGRPTTESRAVTVSAK